MANKAAISKGTKMVWQNIKQQKKKREGELFLCFYQVVR
jgi:hypothetical protein